MEKGELNTPKEPQSLSKSEREELELYREARQRLSEEYIIWRYHEKHLCPKIKEAREKDDHREVERLQKAIYILMWKALSNVQAYFREYIGDEKEIQETLEDLEEMGESFDNEEFTLLNQLIKDYDGETSE